MNMNLSKLTQEGLEEFTVFLDNINQIVDVKQRREEILSTMSVEVDDIECMPIESSSRSKLKVTEYLATLLDSASISPETDKELWAWLSLYYFETIHKKNKKTNMNWVILIDGFLILMIIESIIAIYYWAHGTYTGSTTEMRLL